MGELVRGLAPELAQRCDLELYAGPGGAPGELAGIPLLPIERLDPGRVERLLAPVGDEAALAFLLPAIRFLGGTVLLRSWELGALARAAFPRLASGGLRGCFVALREGGLAEAGRYAGAQRRGGACAGLSLNRSVVRHADSFLVHDPALLRRILDERNARTPIACVPEGPLEDLATASVAALAELPGPRRTRQARIGWRAHLGAAQRASAGST
jgi:hypothetical protein